MSVHTNRRSLLRLFLEILPAVGLSTIAGEYVIAAETEGHPLIVLPGEIRRYRGQKGRENATTELLATSEETGGTLGLFRQTIAPAGGPPRHLHLREDEFAYVVSGQFEFL